MLPDAAFLLEPLAEPVIAAPSPPADHCEMNVTRGWARGQATAGMPAIAAMPAVPARKSRRLRCICLSLGITKIVSGDILLRQAARVA